MKHGIRHILCSTTIALGAIAGMTRADAPTATPIPDRYEPVPPQMQRDTSGVGITEHLGGKIPLDLTFTDTSGRDVTLGEYFNKKRPVIIQMGYFNCPMICDVVSEKIIEGVKGLDLQMGQDFDVLYVSVNPKERWQLGQQKKRSYIEAYGKPGAIEGWNFLVGQEAGIKKLTDAIGFGFRKVEGRDEWSHPPMIAILTSDGTISRYFYGNDYPSEQLRMSLVEAGRGQVGSYVEQVLIGLCYHYDGYAGKYTPRYMMIMQIGGAITVLIVFGILGRLWIRDAMGKGKHGGPRMPAQTT